MKQQREFLPIFAVRENVSNVLYRIQCTVAPLNKGHVGVMGPAILSFVERLSALQRFKMY